MSHSSVFALYKDTQGGIWIGTYFGGVNYYNPTDDHTSYYEANPDMPHALSFPVVGKMQEDAEHNLWICTEGGGLNFLDRQTRQFTRYVHNKGGLSGIGHNNLKCIWLRKETGQLYIGTHTGGLTIFDTRRKTAHTLKNSPDKANSLPSNVINDLQPYKGKLVLSTQAGIVAMNPETETFEPLSPLPDVRSLIENYIYVTFHIDRNDNIWLANGNGGITRVNLLTGKRQNYRHDLKKEHNIGRFKVLHIFENHLGELFFSTAGSGLFKYEPETDSFFRFAMEDNLLMSNYCYYVAESPSHELFVLHNRGISCLNSEKKELTYTYVIPYMSFGQGSCIYFTQSGELFLGGTNGLVSLPGIQNLPTSNDHQFYFDQLIINNKVIQPGDESHILSQTMPYTESIKLAHNQNSLILEIATSNYTQNKYKYEYQLEGFDRTWLPLHSPKIVYTNLDPGYYKLTVREKNDSHDLW